MSSEDHLETYDLHNEENVANKKYKRGRRLYYPSNPHSGGVVCNAVTGSPYPYTFGSRAQQVLYKVVDSTGTCDSDGYSILRRDPRNPNPNHLFFDSPEECMSHMRIEISDDTINTWRLRKQQLEYLIHGNYNTAILELTS
jgi:hypothetical protein